MERETTSGFERREDALLSVDAQVQTHEDTVHHEHHHGTHHFDTTSIFTGAIVCCLIAALVVVVFPSLSPATNLVTSGPGKVDERPSPKVSDNDLIFSWRAPVPAPFLPPLTAKEALPTPALKQASSDSGKKKKKKEKVIASLDLQRQAPLMDLVSIVDRKYTGRIRTVIHSIEKDVPGCEVQVLLVNDISSGWSTPKRFVTALFNTWALGNSKTNNGVLILLLLDTRRIEVEVGANLDWHMSPSWTTKVLQERAVPEFRNGNYGLGIYNVLLSIGDRLRETIQPMNPPARDKTRPTITPTPKYEKRGDSRYKNRTVAIADDITEAYLVLALIGLMVCAVGGCVYHDRTYPLGDDHLCSQCGHYTWRHDRWQVLLSETYDHEGLRRRHCICRNCHKAGFKDYTVQKLRSREDSSSYGGIGGDYDFGGDDGGGFASGDGGGGASW